jgi:hypothetical protein
MALILTPEVFLELMMLCLTWEWERALDRSKATHNREHPLYPTQIGWTTVDKIVRILHGLDIVSKKQKSVLYKDRRLQHLVLRHSDMIGAEEAWRSRKTSAKDLLLQGDLSEDINREKMLRNMRFYITESGLDKAKLLSAKYAASITKVRYFAEIEKQKDQLPRNPGAMPSVMTIYRQKVEKETKGK